MVPPSSSSSASAAAVAVLADATLLRCITRFMSGYPQLVTRFYRDVSKAPIHNKKSTEAFKFPRMNGLLVQLAIMENDQRVLEMLYRLALDEQEDNAKRSHATASRDGRGAGARMTKRAARISRRAASSALCFRGAMRGAAYYGRLDMLKWLYTQLVKHEARYAAVVNADDGDDSGGGTNFCTKRHSAMWLDWDSDLLNHALQSRSIEVLDWVFVHCNPEVRCESVAHTLKTLDIDKSAALGDLAVVQWLEAHEYTFTSFAMVAAAERGHLHVVKYLLEKQQVIRADDDVGVEHQSNLSKALSHAVRKGHTHVVEYLLNAYRDSSVLNHDQRSTSTAPLLLECSSAELAKAASEGFLDAVRLIHENLGTLVTGSFTHAAMDKAATNGHFEMVQFLHFQCFAGCSSAAMDGAARFDHLEIVEFLHSHRSEGCTTAAMNEAARFGHLEIVEFLHSHRSEGCTAAAMDSAAANCHINVVRFLNDHRPEGCTTLAMDIAAAKGYLHIVRFLHENRFEGCTTDAMDDAAAHGYLSVVEYLHEHRGEGCTVAAMDRAASGGYLEIVKFLHANRHEGCTTRAIDCAACRGDLEMVAFLYANRSEGYTQHAVTTEEVYERDTGNRQGVMDFLERNQEKKKAAPRFYYRTYY